MTVLTHTRTMPTNATSGALGSVFDRVFARIFTFRLLARFRSSNPPSSALRDGTDPLLGGQHRRHTDQYRTPSRAPLQSSGDAQ